jgi:hypothetical protein
MKEKLPLEILILAGRLSLDGVVTVWVNSARKLRVVDKNLAKLSKLSAWTAVHQLRQDAASQANRLKEEIAVKVLSSIFILNRFETNEYLKSPAFIPDV